MKLELTFKHSRKNFIQSIYGGLDEDSSLIAVDETSNRLEQLFEEIDKASEEDDDFTDGKVIEMCCNKAESIEELVIFIHEVASASACPQHPFIQMITNAKGGMKD